MKLKDAPWKGSYDKLDSILKSRDITLPTKVCIVKAMVFLYGKTRALTLWTFVGKVISLLFNTPSRFVTALLTKSKSILIS